ncbi:N-formylglutamate amidohydrolase [Luteimonas chenhongjianii]|uniref:N-formylglutamate amidohydrolase n=1 Tax=Luteimonas chenhongjianii TaxID=2006110 RepID=A0A290XF93_9GAMM|nr:N-formylglutamate amidohydrolase [Luteimonas chenhongjianii]ATD67810.1 N-formylglutamate amidohydrolase [Luteimonas chenhongjianii]
MHFMPDARRSFPTSLFSDTTPPALRAPGDAWDLVVTDGPVIATAIHDGHALRESLRARVALDDEARWREEDPLTSLLTQVGDTRLRVRQSRFEVDLNRPRAEAVYATPEACWGLDVWKAPLDEAELQASLALHDRFYDMVGELIDRTVARWGSALLIDIHSYNHRRDGPDAAPAAQDANPDIELGITTLDADRWGDTARRFANVLRRHPVRGALPDVRCNVRFPTGGHFPEWVYAHWGDKVCTISPEYKKIFMDEWTGKADMPALYALRDGLEHAVDAVRPEFLA